MNNNTADKDKGTPKAVVAAIVIAVVVVAAVMLIYGKKSYEPIVAGSTVIDFTLPDMNGGQVNLKDYRGKVVFLNFWATWCKPCEEELPSMQQLHQTLNGQPFEMLAVSIDSDTEPVKKFISAYGLTFTVLHDRNGKMKDRYKTTGVPETFIIDQNGVVAEKIMGPRNWALASSITSVVELLKYGPRTSEEYKGAKAVKKMGY
ncbi:MAG: TlpA family protein disulfide reductase [Deltaproteobacteria bacterium]|nr:TlpA family protein disulfide reductase [Deltaproteobacteria bacterium]